MISVKLIKNEQRINIERLAGTKMVGYSFYIQY